MSTSPVESTGSGKSFAAVLAALCVICGLLVRTPAVAQAAPSPATLPQGAVVTRGQVTFQTTGTAGSPVLNIDQTSPRAVIDWNTFNVGSAATVNFNQPNAQSATLNRVSDLNPSQIFGRINAPGQVTLINPAGIYFGPTAVLDVGALTATAMQQSDADFMAGNASFLRNGASGSVVNDGTLTARLGGYIALLAPEVRNQGTIIARQGAVVLAAGEAIRLIFDPASRLANLTVSPSQIAALVENKTAVQAPDGLIIFSATAIDRLMGNVINSGQVNASSLTAKGGRIVLEADAISLLPASQISATGATGGGEILIGGDWQGTGAVDQATTVTLADTATIDASATVEGNGGKIVLWSDVHNLAGRTAVAGQITARGAGAKATGGQVETSGHRLALADSASVALGNGGQWLLDPADVTISNGADSNHDVSFTPNSSAATSVVNITTLLTALNAGTDVTVTTTNAGVAGGGNGDLTVSNAVATTGAGAGGLTLNAARNLLLNANITLTGTGKPLTFIAGGNVDQGSGVAVTTAGGAVTYDADRDGNLSGAVGLRSNASVSTNGGNLTMGGGTDPLTMPAYGESVFTSGISIDNTNVVLNAGGGNISLRGHTEWGNGGVAANSQAQILTTGSGSITIIGDGGATGYGVGLDRTTISAQNGAITIVGITAPAGREAVVSRVGHKIESTGSGPISISGVGGTGVYFGGWGQTFVIGGNSATGNITIAADLLTFSDVQATVQSTGTLTFKPYTAGATIGIGSGAGALKILSSYFASNFVNGFSGITIGDATSGNVTLGGATATSDALNVVTAGNITINAAASIATSRAGGTLALAAGGNFVNNSGAGAVSTTDAGASDRWIVYSATPASNTFGGLLSGNLAVWGETFGSQAPGAVAAGNRYVFAAPASVTITTTSNTKLYGTVADVSGNVTYTGLPLSGATYGNAYTSLTVGTLLSTLPTISSSGAAASAGVLGGPYAITASGAVANSGYTFSYANTGTLTVSPAHLTVTAGNQARLYGATNPAFTTTLSGFVNGEVLGTSGVTGSGSATTTATAGTSVGPAVITAATGTLSAGNYDFTNFVDGTLTIGKAHLTVTADNQARLYGATNPALTTTLSGFVNSEVLGTSGVTGSGSATTTATASTGVGPAVITAGAGTLAAGNYDFTNLVDGTLTIGKAHLTVTADNQARLYGAANPALTTTLSGFVNSEVLGTSGVTGSGSATTTATAGTSVGPAIITAATGTLSAGNYDFTTFVNGTLTIGKAHLTVTADNQTRLYGAANPALTTTLSGFANGEVLGTSGVTGNGSATTTATSGTGVGPAVITAASGTLAAGNYDFTNFVDGTLMIGRAHLTVTADNQNRLYGSANPTLTTTLSGFVNGETLASSGVTGSGVATTAATASTPAGTAVITAGAGTLAASNYDFATLVDGALTIGRAHLTVTADNQSRLYGAANPTLTTTLSGFVNGETLVSSGVTGGGGASTAATPGTNVGTALITATPGTLAASNYDFTTFINGSLAIGKAGLTVTANNDGKIFNGSAYAGGNGVTYAGFVNGEGSGVLGGVLSYSGSSQGAINAGNYVIAPGGLTSGNYALNFVNGALAVSPASLSAIIGSLTGTTSKVYDGTTTATLTPGNYLLTGFAGSDGVAVTKTGGVFDSPNAGAGKLVTVNLSGSDYTATGTTLLSNYSLPSIITGSIGTITPKPVSFVAPVVSKIYDGNASANAGVTASLLSELSGQLGVTGDRVTGIALTFDNKNVGAGKTLNASSATISDGNNGNNYVITYAGNNTSAITRLSSVTWIGGANGNWFDAANWAGGAVPDLANVARVFVPAGASVTFGSTDVTPGQSRVVQLDSLTAQGGLVVTGGELGVGAGGIDLASLRQSGGTVTSLGAARFASFEQTGGVISVTGNFDATSQFNQSGAGGLSVGGTTTIMRTQGDVVLGNLTGIGALTVTNAGGAIAQSQGTALNLQSPGIFAASNQGNGAAITLDQTGNHFGGTVSASGSEIILTDMNALTLGIVTSSGRLAATSNGALNLGRSTVGGDLSAHSGNGAITQTGPLRVAGRTELRSGTGRVALSDGQNFFGFPVIVSGNGVTILDPTADAVAQRYGKLQAGDVFFGNAIPARNYFRVEDIDTVFAESMDGAANSSDKADAVVLLRGSRF